MPRATSATPTTTRLGITCAGSMRGLPPRVHGPCHTSVVGGALGADALRVKFVTGATRAYTARVGAPGGRSPPVRGGPRRHEERRGHQEVDRVGLAARRARG